jgi:tetratricopeptide (TPR) repeat protein
MYTAIRAALSSNRFAEASDMLSHIQKQASGDPEYWLLQGVCSSQARKMEDAEVFFRKSIELDPTFVDGWIHLAEFYEETHSWKAAFTTYTKALDTNPKSAKLCLAMAAFYQFQAAGVSVGDLGIDPEALLLRGSAEDHLHKAADFAFRAWETNIRTKELNSDEQERMLFLLGSIFISLGLQLNAEGIIRELRKIAPNSFRMQLLESEFNNKSWK